MNFIKLLQENPVDLQPVICCKDCEYFIPCESKDKDAVFDGVYKDYPWWMCEEIEMDGLCVNNDKWQESTGFCSDAKYKTENNEESNDHS